MSTVKKRFDAKFLKTAREIAKEDAVKGQGGIARMVVGMQFDSEKKHWHYSGDEPTDLELLGVAMKQKKLVINQEVIDEQSNIIPPDTSNTSNPLLFKKFDLTTQPQPQIKDRKIIFKHSRALGDALMFTCGVRDFKLLFPEIQINVDSNFPALWENNPYIDRSITKDTTGVEFYRVGYPLINNANGAALSFHSAFLMDMIAAADFHQPLPMRIGEFTAAFANGRVGDPDMGDTKKNPTAKEPFVSLRNKYNGFCKTFARQWGDLHLTEKEKATSLIKELYGLEKYWVVAPGGKRDCTCKMWDWRRFQQVVNHFENRIKFVVIGKSNHLVEKLNGVIDLTDKFNKDIRGLIPLVYHAEGCVSGVTFLMHLAGAMPPRLNNERKPCVAIYGGREPTNFTAYCNHQILHTNGAFNCCENGGCWQSRVHALQKNADANKRMCHSTEDVSGRTIQNCMNVITSDDVIRAIEKYYDGDIYTYLEHAPKPKAEIKAVTSKEGKEINILASLQSKGGGEQSACKIASILRENGWKVNLHPWATVHDNYKYITNKTSFKDNMVNDMVAGVPLLFYANDQMGEFVNTAQEVVNKSSALIVGVNYVNRPLPTSTWIAKTNKLKAVIFQNEEKKKEWDRDAIGFDATKKIVMFGAIELDKYLEVCPVERKNKDTLVILKHCCADYRKYVTEASVSKGQKIHLWQKNIIKETDIKFYRRLLKDVKNIRFEFMEAHKELIDAFKGESRMVFHKWNAMSVSQFLSRGHIYLYRTSNAWRDQYPRVVAEALAAGLPVLSEPRDGTKDRMDFGNIGFHCVDYDGFLYAIKLLQRKEGYRHHMGMRAKDWARQNLDPRKWVEVIEEVLSGQDV